MSGELMTIGELANRTGVAASALRYWEDLGLLPPPERVSGQRRYPRSAVARVGLVVLLRDVGFTLVEAKAMIAARSLPGDDWRVLAERKITELDRRIAHAEAAREAIAHAICCPCEDILECPTFTGVVAARLSGTPFDQAHSH
jgi:DNA-binding transcriptional MerR regulator